MLQQIYRNIAGRVGKNEIDLVVVSGLILFLELALIRFIPAQVRHVGFFSNIILLAAFVGMGVGSMFRKKLKKLHLGWLVLGLLVLVAALNLVKYQVDITSEEVVYFTVLSQQFSSEPVFLLPLIFAYVGTLFASLGVVLGNQLSKLPALPGYALNIGGSIAGILLFSLGSYLGAGPVVWFGVVALLILWLLRNSQRWLIVGGMVGLAAMVGFEYWSLTQVTAPNEQVIWSPYYKVTLIDHEEPEGPDYTIDVNHIGHQVITSDLERLNSGMYSFPYREYPERTFEEVLVIGSGAGNDVAQALAMGAERVVAVEIDPVIYELGREYHPLQPYDDPRVERVIDDGRHYLTNAEEQFDLVIFALTDSLTLTSSQSNVRLESYLFTREAVEAAASLLDPEGLLVMYNYYRQPWLVDKLYLLLENVFERAPAAFVRQDNLGAVLIGAFEGTPLPVTNYEVAQAVPVPSDDWPFLYLKERGVSSFYLKYIGVISLMVFLVVRYLRGSRVKQGFNWRMFFMGAAFMLLETKNVVQFSLLFGSTWVTNSMVFVGILSMVLLAILLVRRLPDIPAWPVLGLLLASIGVSYLIPPNMLLGLSYGIRLLAAIVLYFSPVFVANILFALLYRKEKKVPDAFGANILGSFAGGVMEYFSMWLGYASLLWLVAGLYVAAVRAGRE